MRPISFCKTASDCAEALREMNELDVQCGRHLILADYIHDLTRWIPVSERMPTAEDLHSYGTFRIWLNGGDGLACIHHNKIYVWDNDGFVDYDETNFRVAFTHWQQITPPEGAC